MSKNDLPHVQYFEMGPWPVYVGCTTNAKAFAKEVERLCPGENIPFISTPQANACTHAFSRGSDLTIIVCAEPCGKTDPKLYIGLLAHECVHILQQIRENIISPTSNIKEGLGIEAEAYMLQYLLQGMMAVTLDAERAERKAKRKAKPKKE